MGKSLEYPRDFRLTSGILTVNMRHLMVDRAGGGGHLGNSG